MVQNKIRIHAYAFFPCADIAAVDATSTATIRYAVSDSSIGAEVLNAAIFAFTVPTVNSFYKS